MIGQVKLLEIIGRFHTVSRGPALLLRGEVDNGQIPVFIYRQGFPCGLIEDFLIGEKLGCTFVRSNLRMHAEILPLENQSGDVMSVVVNKLLNIAEVSGSEAIEDLPELSRKQIEGPLPPPINPRVRDLEKFFKLSIEEPDYDDGLN